MRVLNVVVLVLVVSGCDARVTVGIPSQGASPGAPAERTSEPAAAADRAVGGGLAVAVTGSPMRHGHWVLADGSTLVLRPHGVLVRQVGSTERPVATQVLGLPAVSADGKRYVFSHRISGRCELKATALTASGWSAPRVLWHRGRPDRPALTPDGKRVVFAAGNRGVSGLWVIGFDGRGVTPLTNDRLDLRNRVPGQPPAGFVPMPHRGPPTVLLDRVRWEAPDGWHEVVLP